MRAIQFAAAFLFLLTLHARPRLVAGRSKALTRIFPRTVSKPWILVAIGLAAPAAGQCNPSWQEGFGIAGVSMATNSWPRCYTAVEWDPDGPGPRPPVLVAAGDFNVSGKDEADGFAVWDGTQWSAFAKASASGLRWNQRKVLFVHGGTLYAGGEFELPGSSVHGGIARWDGSEWLPVGGGLGAQVACLGEFQGSLIAGGSFSPLHSGDPARIAQWDGQNWLPVGPAGAIDGPVSALCTHNGRLVVGTPYPYPPYSYPLARISAWDGQRWEALGAGMGGPVLSLASVAGTLYAGGGFEWVDEQDIRYVAAWNGSRWTRLGDGLDGGVSTLAQVNGELWVGGSFILAGGLPARSLAKWNGSAWQALGHGVTGGGVNQISSFLGIPVVAGMFISAGNTPAAHVARWDGSDWAALGTGVVGPISAIGLSDGSIAVAQTLTTGLFGPTVVARRDGGVWRQLGEAFDREVRVLFDDGNGLIAGGSFHHVGEREIQGVARWDGVAWQAIGDGLAGVVNAITLQNGSLVAAGGFERSGSRSVREVAWWDGSAWQQLGTGLSQGANTVAIWNGELYVGGGLLFTGFPTAYVARLASDGTWQPVGQSLGHIVYALTVYNNELIAGGYFSSNSTNCRFIARFDGTLWQPLGGDQLNGLGQRVLALATRGPDLIAVGEFATTWGPAPMPLSHIGRWDGAHWHALDAGLDSSTTALLATQTAIYAGGTFLHAGGQISAYLARWSCTCYPNCDGSSTAPTLNVRDFICFLNQFAAALSLPPEQQATSYANCDNSTAAPALGVNDFLCFQQRFAAGCP